MNFARDLKEGALEGNPIARLDRKLLANRVEHCFSDDKVKTVYNAMEAKVDPFKVAFKMRVTINKPVPTTREFKLAATLSRL